MRLQCPKCASDIPARDVNIDNMVAKCSQCDNVFDFSAEISSRNDFAKKPTKMEKPATFTRTVSGGTMQLSWRWYTHMVWFLVVFTIFWVGFLITWLSAAAGTGSMQFFVVPHILAGVGLTYYVVALFINTTVVTVTHQSLQVRHKPLPWLGMKTIERKNIEQIFTNDYMGGNKNRTRYYAVNAIIRGEGQKRFVGRLQSAEHALYIEQELEDFLGIHDQPVRGELSRGK